MTLIKQKDCCFIVHCLKPNIEHIFVTLLTLKEYAINQDMRIIEE